MPHGGGLDRDGADPCGDGPPEGWRGVFLTALRETGNVSAAARRAGTSRSVCYARRRRDTAFAAAWEDALEEAADRLEMEAFRRAVDGVGEVPQATGFMSSQVEWTPVRGSFFDGSGSGFDVLIGRDILCQGVFTMSFDGHVTFSR